MIYIRFSIKTAIKYDFFQILANFTIKCKRLYYRCIIILLIKILFNLIREYLYDN